jgi:hypothetical protein
MDYPAHLKSQILQFLDEIIEQFPTEKDFLLGKMAITYLDPQSVVNMCTQYVLPFKTQILNKDEKFFLNDQFLFTNKNVDAITNIKRIWLSDKLDTDDRETVWLWFKTFALLIDKIVSPSN